MFLFGVFAARADRQPEQEAAGAAGGEGESPGGRPGQQRSGGGGGGPSPAGVQTQRAGQVQDVCGRPGQGGEPAAVSVGSSGQSGERPQQSGGGRYSRGEGEEDYRSYKDLFTDISQIFFFLVSNIHTIQDLTTTAPLSRCRTCARDEQLPPHLILFGLM